jgi:ABC-type Mn2+/Zn2+ transport system permease subunit
MKCSDKPDMQKDVMKQQLMDQAPEKVRALALGALLIVVTTTVPYLTLINALFFAGIFLSGAIASYYYIVTCQVKLSFSEAFLFSFLSGVVGSILSVVISYVLLTTFQYRPGIEGLLLLIDWMEQMAPEQPELSLQLKEILEAPVELTIVDFLLSVVVTVFLYSPVSGLGGVFSVWRLKRQARRGEGGS